MKILRLYFSTFLLLLALKGNTQNIISNSQFESMTTADCHAPTWATQFLQDWYTTAGTPDMYIRGCNHLFTGWYLWYRAVEPNSFLSLGGAMQEAGYMSSEAISIQLIDTVETGQYYHFEIKARNQGIGDPALGEIPCVTNPPKSIDIYFSNMEIPPENYDGVPSFLGEKILSFTNEDIADTTQTYEWTKFKTCLVGRDKWQYMTVSLPQTEFTTQFPCIIDTNSAWNFNGFEYDIDDIYMVGFPKAQTFDLLLCTEEGKIEYDASNLFEHPLAIENSEIIWQDGSTDLQYTFTEAGEYQMDIIVECGIIPIKFNIIAQRCTPAVSVPTAFSPNYDGINDELFPFFKTDFPIQNYEFMVFDRWGNTFYRSSINDGFTGWNGKVNGKEATVGTYVWAISFEMLNPNGEWQTFQLSGDTLLMR